MVMREFSAPTYTPAQFRDLVYDAMLRAPICFDPKAAKEVMPYYELRTKLAMQGKNPDQIGEGVQAAYARGNYPREMGASLIFDLLMLCQRGARKCSLSLTCLGPQPKMCAKWQTQLR
jgi:hypothetical protein